MDKFKALIYKENEKIELESSEQLDKLYETIEGENNFILQWMDDGILKSEVIIVTNISGKVKNGEIKLTAKEDKRKK